MNKPSRLVLGAGVPLLALLFYFWGEREEPSSRAPMARTAHETTATQTQAAPKPKAATTSPLAPSAPSPSEEKFEEPESEELFWQELERLEREDKQEALAYALSGEDWYGDEGKPAEARRAKIVTLLVSLGKMEEARARTRAFIEKYPDSSYRRLVQGVTGIHPRPGAPRTP